MMSEALISFSTSAIIIRPAWRDKRRISVMVAGASADPGSAMPRASAMHCMVLAVPRKVQAPTDGQPVR